MVLLGRRRQEKRDMHGNALQEQALQHMLTSQQESEAAKESGGAVSLAPLPPPPPLTSQ
jgi:hypothetical protein